MKNALFGFNGEPMCFVHVLLNALDLAARGHEARVVVEGCASRLVPELADKGHAFRPVRTLSGDVGPCRLDRRRAANREL